MKRYFEFIGADASRASGKAEKFWEITLTKAEIKVRFGKIGAAGQTNLKTFADAKTASKEAEKLISEKVKKGYIENGTGISSPVKKTPPKINTKGNLIECVACAEGILAAAKLCKHCGTMQNDPRFVAKTVSSKSETKFLDSRIKTVLACAIDYSSWGWGMSEEGEEESLIKNVAKNYSIKATNVQKIRDWWFASGNQFLNRLKNAILKFAKDEGCNSGEIETIDVQFDSDIFCADFIVYMKDYMFDEAPQGEVSGFGHETFVYEEIELPDLYPIFTNFFKSDIPAEITKSFFDSKAGKSILEVV